VSHYLGSSAQRQTRPQGQPVVDQIAQSWQGHKVVASADQVSPPKTDWIEFQWQWLGSFSNFRPRRHPSQSLTQATRLLAEPPQTEGTEALFESTVSEISLFSRGNGRKYQKLPNHRVSASISNCRVLDKKIKTTVINLASNFLQKFLAAEYKQSFCCSNTTQGHFSGFRDLIADGKIFVLDIRSNEHGTIANALGTLVKLNYQAAVKTRDRYQRDKMSRATVFCMDEAQSFITPSSSNTEGDDKYLEMSRSFLAIDIYATQQYSSFKAAVGADMTQRIIGSFNNIISYKHNDPELTKYIQSILGNEEQEEKSMNISESSSSAKTDVLAVGGTTEIDHQVSRSVSLQKKEKPIVDAAVFKSLSTFEAIGLFDCPDGLQVSRFFTKPYFVDCRTPQASVLQKMREQAEE
jgi:hypothetical protein